MDEFYNPMTEEEKTRNLRQQVLYSIPNRERPVEDIITDAKRIFDFIQTGK